ncbi:uncharacterized protein [Lolium perenne]|uniref:uncharacterized protein n=1 Tax=Lolium perenne TaxID=4522 RepID=UPI0021F503EC|nr:uncharacterized protein LOC127303897 [Lolium perenne]
MESATSQGSADWSSMPTELLVLILNRLRWSSHPSFALVCKQWRSAVSPFYPAWITPLLLMSYNVGTTNVRYYSPYYHRNFEIDNTLPGAKIVCSAGQHLALHLDGNRILDVELMSGAVHELPPIDEEVLRATLHSVVYDGMGTMYALDPLYGRMRIIRSIRNNVGMWEDWNYAELDLDDPMIMSSPDGNPVLHNGSMHILFEDGRLGVYDDRRQMGSFEILEKPLSFGFEYEYSYLVEDDEGVLMAVLFGRHGEGEHEDSYPINVVKLNEHTMEWENVENLEGRAVFTGTPTTVMKKTNVKWMQNKVFLPRFCDWPETVRVDLVQRDGEFAFVPKQGCTEKKIKTSNCGTDIWSYELGQHEEEAREYVNVLYTIWVDFDSS